MQQSSFKFRPFHRFLRWIPLVNIILHTQVSLCIFQMFELDLRWIHGAVERWGTSAACCFSCVSKLRLIWQNLIDAHFYATLVETLIFHRRQRLSKLDDFSFLAGEGGGLPDFPSAAVCTKHSFPFRVIEWVAGISSEEHLAALVTSAWLRRVFDRS